LLLSALKQTQNNENKAQDLPCVSELGNIMSMDKIGLKLYLDTRKFKDQPPDAAPNFFKKELSYAM
jgi:hypothetical protein